MAVKKKSSKKVVIVIRKKKAAKMGNVTKGCEFKGTIKFDQSIRVDGKFDGEIISDNGELIVGKAGNVKATVKVKSAVIKGRVEGNIRASDNIELKEGAHIIGNLQAKTFVAEKGVVFVGKCNINPEETKIESQSYKEGIKEEIKVNRLVNENSTRSCNMNPEGTKIESQSYKEGTKEETKEEIKVNRLVNEKKRRHLIFKSFGVK